MEAYQKPYYILFNAATDALRAMEAQNYGRAQRFLMQPYDAQVSAGQLQDDAQLSAGQLRDDAQFSADPLRKICASDAQVSSLCSAQNLRSNKNNIEINNLIRKRGVRRRKKNRCFFRQEQGGSGLWV